MSDLKQKFIDILFEDETEDEEEEVKESPVFKSKKEKEEEKKAEEKKAEEKKAEEAKEAEKPVVLAKDILYRKSSKSAFIDLNSTTKGSHFDLDENNQYEMSSQISPMFGLLSDDKKKVEVKQSVIETQINKPFDSHLDIVPSPIYGYGNKEDALKNNYNVKGLSGQDNETDSLFASNEEPFDTLPNEDDDNQIDLFELFGENK